MKLGTKKIIAREFILIVTLLGISGIVFLLTYPYNSYLNHKINDNAKEITNIKTLADSLSKPYYDKTFKDMGDYVSRVYLTLTDIGYKNLTTETEFRSVILSDSILRKSIYSSLKENIDGFTKSESQFNSALRNQLTKEDVENRNKAKALETQIEELKHDNELVIKKILDYDKQIKFSLNTLIVLTLLLYVLRPLVYLFKWSLTTLRKTE